MFKRKYSDKEINKIIDSITILVDTREKQNSHVKLWLKSNKINYMDYALKFGDYSFMIPKNELYDISEDIFFNDYIAIERKANAEEISSNFSQNRERFENEFTKGSGKLRLLIEDTTYSQISNGQYNTKFNPKSFISSLHSFQEKYDTPFIFMDKINSAEYIYNTFKFYLKEFIK